MTQPVVITFGYSDHQRPRVCGLLPVLPPVGPVQLLYLFTWANDQLIRATREGAYPRPLNRGLGRLLKRSTFLVEYHRTGHELRICSAARQPMVRLLYKDRLREPRIYLALANDAPVLVQP